MKTMSGHIIINIPIMNNKEKLLMRDREKIMNVT